VPLTSQEAAVESGESVRVAIGEDDRATREGLGLLIGGTPGYQCVGTFRSVEDALRSLSNALPDVLLLDIHLPGMLGSDGGYNDQSFSDPPYKPVPLQADAQPNSSAARVDQLKADFNALLGKLRASGALKQ